MFTRGFIHAHQRVQFYEAGLGAGETALSLRSIRWLACGDHVRQWCGVWGANQ